ncbi:nuclear transport factor 2 family protein [Phormidium tenue FACHB-886]|nr:nuclear transport factor 2 family protein [Phormidium tenue FACHB-886]
MRIWFSAPRSIAPTSSRSGLVLCHLGLPLLLLGLTLGGAGQAQAQSAPQAAPQSTSQAAPAAPPQITQALTQIDAAANQQDLAALLSFYAPTFTSTDGLTLRDMEAALRALWERYPNLSYSTRINSWQEDGDAIVVETTTTITSAATPVQPASQSSPQLAQPSQLSQTPAAEAAPSRTFSLASTITSRQRFESEKIVQQEILSERTQLTSGDNPPTLDISLPQEIRTGQAFDFDAVVREPLGDRLLLGAALEEPIRTSGYLNATTVNLEPLSAGGIFKVGRAPMTPDSRWVSAVVVRDDGITAITQRLQVSPSGAPQSSTPPNR